MGKMKKMYFYYGAILNAILEHNPDASPVLILNDKETRQAYRILTNTSKQECVLFFKYASMKTGVKKDTYSSWLFSFSQDDKQKLKIFYNENKLPVFICLLCLKEDLKNSEIAILKYEEYLKKAGEKQSITIGLENGKHNFMLFTDLSKSRDDTYKFPTNRITKKFDDLAEEVIRESQKKFVNKNQYHMGIDSLILQNIKTYEDSNLCPLCGEKLECTYLRESVLDIMVKKCPSCNSIFLRKEYYRRICKNFGCQRLKDNVYIMPYEMVGDSINEKIIVENNEHKDKQQENQHEIFVMREECDICPIHNIKMKVKVIDMGKGKKDTVFYCPSCSKMIVSSKHKQALERMANVKGSLKKFVFFNLKI